MPNNSDYLSKLIIIKQRLIPTKNRFSLAFFRLRISLEAFASETSEKERAENQEKIEQSGIHRNGPGKRN